MGSASEMEYHLLLAHDLELLDAQSFHSLSEDVTEIKRRLSSLIKKLRAES
jgi:four helix bundle protein